VVTASGDTENDGHAGWWSLFLFFPSVDALYGDDEGDNDENVLCWLSSRPCLCVFLLLTVAFCFLCLASLSFLLVFPFSFFSVLSFLFLFFSSPFSPLFAAPFRSLEGLIYSLNMSLFRKDSMH
jgi:hypothetical protein